MVPIELKVKHDWKCWGIRFGSWENTRCDECLWAKGTREVYGTGLLVYHIFYNSCNISEDDRGSTSPLLIITFISSCAGAYVGGTLASYVFAVRAWHVLDGLVWSMDDTQVKAVLTGAAVLAPLASRQPKRAPITVDLMECIFNKLISLIC